METVKTFVLANKKEWRREVKVFVLNKDKKFEERSLPFTTEHLVTDKLRTEKGRTVAAEYKTSDPVILEAIYRDTAYGKDFYEKGDAEGKLKRPSVFINEKEKQITALRGLFNMVGLPMDETLPYEVLKEQYEIHVSALSGRKIEKSVAKEIPGTPVDVQASIVEGINAARAKYEQKYGEPVPAIVWDDLAFLDALSNPEFEAQKYISEKIAANEPSAKEGEEKKKESEEPVETLEQLREKYFTKTGQNVPNPKKNDAAWIKAQLEK